MVILPEYGFDGLLKVWRECDRPNKKEYMKVGFND
jgi:hypothetical protein